MYGCDWLVRECIGFGGDWKCINLRVLCSDLCGIFGTVFDPNY
jgi:hypothetical protein